MTRAQLEHIIRAAAEIADDDSIVIVGSQSILATYPAAPDALLVSMEADVYPRHKPERADLIDGSIGEGSPFHELYGYYAQGVGPETAILPLQWQDRLVQIKNANTRYRSGWCLDVHDLAVSKLVAGRPKDIDFIRSLIAHRLVEKATLLQRIDITRLDEERKRNLGDRVKHEFHTA